MTRTGRPCAPTAVKPSRAWRRSVRRGWSSRACGSAPRARGTCPTSSTCRQPSPYRRCGLETPPSDAPRGGRGIIFGQRRVWIFRGGEEENIPRPFGPRKRRARSRREYRNAGSHERFEFDARPRPRCGANTGAGTIGSTPGTLRRLGARCLKSGNGTNGEKTATPARFPRKRS